MREKFKTLSARGLTLTRSTFIPADIRAVVGDLVDLLGDIVSKLEKLESTQPKVIKNGDL